MAWRPIAEPLQVRGSSGLASGRLQGFGGPLRPTGPSRSLRKPGRAERGLPFLGSSERLGDSHNGNFLGLVELLSKYDSLLVEHVAQVRNAQENGVRLQVHYLSSRIQNEFIEICGSFVQRSIIQEVLEAKYFAIAVDATPDCSHQEQLSFIIRYVRREAKSFVIEERFLGFHEFSIKTGEEIATEILEVLERLNLNFQDCVGQAYDNGSNMAGKYAGVQAILKGKNGNCIFSSCANHTLNLVGTNCAEACNEAITFFGTIQKMFNVFSASPSRWEVLKKNVPASLHAVSKTRWSARIDSVKPIANHFDGIRTAVSEISEFKNLTAECKADVRGIKKYLNTFECVVMSSIWIKLLTMIHEINLVIESRNATLDVERGNIDQLRTDISNFREKWNNILQECRHVSVKLGVSDTFITRRGCLTQEDAEKDFRVNVFFKIIDLVIVGLTRRFSAVREICELFDFLWKFQHFNEDELIQKCTRFHLRYSKHISRDEIQSEVLLLKRIFDTNFKLISPSPKEIADQLLNLNLENVFPNLLIALRIFLSLPATVASNERSFNILKRIKSFFRSTMAQERLNGLAMININHDKAKLLDFSCIIQEFAEKKARKAFLNVNT
ncbi:zinc finger MYM-type protein 1-like [Lacerta agilis]|uniref:zinc finger MYM-type protein 1-like n=1 Tax=Lacerta agilis TaxID=80427 RepID=UPI001419475A|nr:zinc finger MYM-type protein 1-like [Lacerta agilis]